MKMNRKLLVIVMLLMLAPIYGQILKIKRNRITFGKDRGDVLYCDSGDLNGDGRIETVFSMSYLSSYENHMIIVARNTKTGWSTVAIEEGCGFFVRTDVTDVNGDHKDEIVVRGLSGDGHGMCTIYALRKGKLVDIGPEDRLGATKLRDLNRDGIPELLSITPVSFMFVGDHWLTIYKWNGKGYTDVSRRFPREYDAVIKDLNKVMHDLQFTKNFGDIFTPEANPELFYSLHFYLGKAYEYRGLPEKAKEEYALAEKLKEKAE